uniref:Anti-silencing function protein 1 n=1 Tax=Timema douglasi TaxID=61478 RepID=A0A7R8VKK1_TIMDO|nr:unnamed protein product [Timema douglasi]
MATIASDRARTDYIDHLGRLRARQRELDRHRDERVPDGADPPDVAKIPVADALGVTVVLLTSSYKGQEFVRVGYFINNEYTEPELKENPPTQPQFDKVARNILSSQPRVTRFKINWDDSDTVANPIGLELLENHEESSMPVPSTSAVFFSENSSQSAMEVM